ncbi:aKG-HExxH-type peptide beta-hydroxylase [Acerihabitans arboris]|uniref:Uncharacterized protein n=1 Tax=Acerihabitans arboris TaxID=2691583 RepID=A0A845SK58_9GAMM|nr:HEXXH motif-containing putative peptide modification protein [Acerihabitans arboris]NDL63011.1 hypothetical protein [Acerihabitans arboris]
MIHLIGVDEVLKNMAVLGAPLSRKSPAGFDEIEFGFHDFLRDYQPDVPRSNILGSQIIDDREMEDKLTELYRTDALLNDREQSSLIGDPLEDGLREKRNNFLLTAIEEMKDKMPKNFYVFQMTIDSLFQRNSIGSGGGSTSNAVGVIWINSRNHWHKQDLTELLIHELTHNLVFIDELRYLHFRDYKLLQKKENYAKSAILNMNRPIDKVFHSIIVAVEVLIARRNYLSEPEKTHVHPPSGKMITQTLEAPDSLTSLENYKNLLTDRGQSLILKCREHIDIMIMQERKSA